jgi:hypothetical protein
MPEVKLPYTPEGEEVVENIKEEVENVGGKINYGENAVVNAPDMRENYQLGGLIPGQPGFGQNPNVRIPQPNVDVDNLRKDVNPLQNEVDWGMPWQGDKEKTVIVPRKEGGKIDKYEKGGKPDRKLSSEERESVWRIKEAHKRHKAKTGKDIWDKDSGFDVRDTVKAMHENPFLVLKDTPKKKKKNRKNK